MLQKRTHWWPGGGSTAVLRVKIIGNDPDAEPLQPDSKSTFIIFKLNTDPPVFGCQRSTTYV